MSTLLSYCVSKRRLYEDKWYFGVDVISNFRKYTHICYSTQEIKCLLKIVTKKGNLMELILNKFRVLMCHLGKLFGKLVGYYSSWASETHCKTMHLGLTVL